MRVLITGIGGFVGGYLAKACHANGHEIHGIIKPGGRPPAQLSGLSSDVQIWEADLLDSKALEEVILYYRPRYIYHLAAITKVRLDMEEARTAFDTNVAGTMHLLEAARKLSIPARILLVSSAQVYGGYDQQTPLGEDLPPFPLTEYGISKAAMEMVARVHHARHGTETIIARSFNHTGPGQITEFVCSAFACQFAEMALGRSEPKLTTGNLEVYRDFTDVRDVCQAYIRLIEHGVPARPYNVCSGSPTQIRFIVEVLQEVTGLSVEIEHDQSLISKAGKAYHYGSNERIFHDVGWKPEIDLRVTLREMVEAWKARLEAEDASGES